MLTEYKFSQPSKHSYPKLVTDDGMVIEVKLLQPLKQLSPKLVTDDGMVIEAKLLHLKELLMFIIYKNRKSRSLGSLL